MTYSLNSLKSFHLEVCPMSVLNTFPNSFFSHHNYIIRRNRDFFFPPDPSTLSQQAIHMLLFVSVRLESTAVENCRCPLDPRSREWEQFLTLLHWCPTLPPSSIAVPNPGFSQVLLYAGTLDSLWLICELTKIFLGNFNLLQVFFHLDWF